MVHSAIENIATENLMLTKAFDRFTMTKKHCNCSWVHTKMKQRHSPYHNESFAFLFASDPTSSLSAAPCCFEHEVWLRKARDGETHSTCHQISLVRLLNFTSSQDIFPVPFFPFHSVDWIRLPVTWCYRRSRTGRPTWIVSLSQTLLW